MLGLSQLELSSPFGYSDEFAENFTSSTSSCGKSGYSFTTPTQYYLNASTTSAAPTATPTVDCSSTYVIQEGDDCHSISIAHTVSTVSLLMLNDLDAWCANFPTAGSSLCIPYSCDIYTVQENDTCWSIVNDHAPDITMTQLRSWNYNINNKCGNLGQMVGDQICIRLVAFPGKSVMKYSFINAVPQRISQMRHPTTPLLSNQAQQPLLHNPRTTPTEPTRTAGNTTQWSKMITAHLSVLRTASP